MEFRTRHHLDGAGPGADAVIDVSRTTVTSAALDASAFPLAPLTAAALLRRLAHPERARPRGYVHG